MKFNINRPPKTLRKQAKINAKREWHRKFAWFPTSADETRDTHSTVWFEKYWRQGRYGPSPMGRASSMTFTNYSEREYFKKKLNGDFDKGESDTMVEGSVSAAQSVGRSLRSPDTKPLISFSADSDTGLKKQ